MQDVQDVGKVFRLLKVRIACYMRNLRNGPDYAEKDYGTNRSEAICIMSVSGA
jgi:hypothetical protein